MNSKRDCGFRVKYVSGRKKWAKKFVHRIARRIAKRKLEGLTND